MAPHVDAVTIAVPNHLHASFCLQAIAAEIPALVEKPLCVSRSELRELETAFASVTVPIHLGYRLRWNTTILQIKQRLARPKRIRCIDRFGMGVTLIRHRSLPTAYRHDIVESRNLRLVGMCEQGPGSLEAIALHESAEG